MLRRPCHLEESTESLADAFERPRPKVSNCLSDNRIAFASCHGRILEFCKNATTVKPSLAECFCQPTPQPPFRSRDFRIVLQAHFAQPLGILTCKRHCIWYIWRCAGPRNRNTIVRTKPPGRRAPNQSHKHLKLVFRRPPVYVGWCTLCRRHSPGIGS